VSEDPDEEPDAALLDRLIGTTLKEVPATVLGRILRLAGPVARAGVAIGVRRLSATRVLDEESLERLVRSLGQLKGVAMKAGQIMSYVDDSLPPEARRMLATLQTHSPAAPFEQIRSVVLR
jgi:predicted unusual protein kinase regulating ubiquinone biosynthesis (AarF/ABC1/UbiB family)